MVLISPMDSKVHILNIAVLRYQENAFIIQHIRTHQHIQGA